MSEAEGSKLLYVLLAVGVLVVVMWVLLHLERAKLLSLSKAVTLLILAGVACVVYLWWLSGTP